MFERIDLAWDFKWYKRAFCAVLDLNLLASVKRISTGDKEQRDL